MPSPRIHKETEYGTYFLTVTALDWLDIFTKPEYFKILADSFKYCVDKKGLILYEYVFMTNHIHLIARSSEESSGLDAVIRDFKSFTTNQIIQQLKKDNRKYILEVIEKSSSKNKANKYQIWQSNNWPKWIESEGFLEQKIGYIWNNPVRKEYVTEPQDWLYSSAKQRLLDLPVDHEDVVLPCADWET